VPSTQPPIVPKIEVEDPLVLEYAENLKAQLGDLYEAEYDKLPLKDRIATMKIVKKTLDKIPNRSEGKAPIVPEPDVNKSKVKNHIQRYEAGEDLLSLPKTSVFTISKPK